MLGSQFTHVSPIATGLYRKHMGTKKQFGESVEPENWFICFDMMWPFFQQAARLFLEHYGGNPDRFCTQEQSEEINQAIEQIRVSPR